MPRPLGTLWTVCLLMLLGVLLGVLIGSLLWNNNVPSAIHVKTVTRYVTITRQTEESIALRNCYTIANGEQDARIYGKCVVNVEKAFAK